jgi:hypothetical protein
MKTQPTALMRITLLALLAAIPFRAAAQTQLPVDPAGDRADLAGVLVYDSNSRTGTLHVLPVEEQKVLEALGAHPVDDHKFLVNAGGPIVIVDINYDGIDLIDATEQIRVYRNRVCLELAPAQFHFCKPESSGQYTTFLQLPEHRCRRTTYSKDSYCTENWRAWSELDVWTDDQCMILDHHETKNRFACGS